METTNVNSSSNPQQQQQTLMSYNTQQDQQMLMYSFDDDDNNKNDNNQEIIMMSNNQNSNNNDDNNNNSGIGMIFSPLQTPQTPTLDNIDWVNLFSQQGLTESSSISPVGSSTCSAAKNGCSHHNNSNDDVVRGSSKGSRGLGCGPSNNNSSSMRKKGVIPRFAFHTISDEDVLDDGYKWRKYGQKSVKNSLHPRSYYRCTYHTCTVKKQIQRHSRDTRIVITTYEGIHNHPSEKLMETLSPLLKQLQFLSRF